MRRRAATSKPGAEFRARLEGDKLVGTIKDQRSHRQLGRRPAAEVAGGDANAKHTYGKPVALFDGNDR